MIAAWIWLWVASSLASLDCPPTTVYDSCAPWDGRALSLSIAGGVRFDIYRDLPTGGGGEYLFKASEPSGNGSARYCPKPGKCVQPESSRLGLKSFQQGVGASGSYELRLKGGAVKKGQFDAPWCKIRIPCG